MHFLCLHGLGTSSEILKAQTESIRRKLRDHTFHFVDGEEDCSPAKGIESVYPGPYFSYYSEPTFLNVAEAHQLLDDVINEEGPFDAILGFSQGAALAASYILHHEADKRRVPFRLAVFICGSLPFSINSNYGIDITEKFAAHGSLGPSYSMGSPSLPKDIFIAHHDLGARKDNDFAQQISSKIRSTIDNTSRKNPYTYVSSNSSELSTPISSTSVSGYQTPLSDYSGDEGENTDLGASVNRIRRFHPASPSPNIQIATVHIYGKQDAYWSQSVGLRDLCCKNKSVGYEHSEGHVIPRGIKSTESMVQVIEQATVLSQL